jgi:hypothetical protein
MKKNKRLMIIDKSDIMICWKCNGLDKRCIICKGTNEFRESHYIYVDTVNKIAIDSDCGA